MLHLMFNDRFAHAFVAVDLPCDHNRRVDGKGELDRVIPDTADFRPAPALFGQGHGRAHINPGFHIALRDAHAAMRAIGVDRVRIHLLQSGHGAVGDVIHLMAIQRHLNARGPGELARDLVRTGQNKSG